MPSVQGAVLDVMVVFVKHRAEEVGIGTSRLATREDVTELAAAALRGDPSRVRLGRGWRWECVGKDLVALLQGRLSVRVKNRRLEAF